ncbi:hypothetical protein N7453_003952 [Penicillium expansum]|nr:hypothetical protein N7453_003952 [Penicillium expansum]
MIAYNLSIPRHKRIPICTCSSPLLSKIDTHIPGHRHMYKLKKPENANAARKTQQNKRGLTQQKE